MTAKAQNKKRRRKQRQARRVQAVTQKKQLVVSKPQPVVEDDENQKKEAKECDVLSSKGFTKPDHQADLLVANGPEERPEPSTIETEAVVISSEASTAASNPESAESKASIDVDTAKISEPEIIDDLDANEKTDLEESAEQKMLLETSDPEPPVKAGLAAPKRHRKLFPALWWALGALCLAGLIVGGVYLVQFLANGQQGTEVSDQQSERPAGSESLAEKTETPTEDPKSAETEPQEPAKEDPTQPEPTTPDEPESMTPIAPRPGNDADPVVTPGSKLIALTFDDGPSWSTTPRLLDILQGRNVKATFFVLGNLAERAPDLIRREQAEGHEVASHTPYHDQLTNLTAEQVRWQALEMDRIFTNILGTVPAFTRPPYGSYNTMVQEAMAQPLILWSVDPRDWADRNASVVCSRVTSAAFDGAIILVHDIHATTVDAVPCIVDNLRAQGYEFLTVSELAAAKDVPLVNGGVYGKF